MNKLRNFIFIISIFLCFSGIVSCQRKKDPVEIKLLLLNPENYFNHNILIRGKIKEIGPLGLWFILEDDSGYIQVTTQNIAGKISCLKKGNMALAFGQLEQYSIHKYFSLQNDLKCL